MNLRSIEKKILDGEDLIKSEEDYLIKKSEEYWDYSPCVTSEFPKWKKILAWVAGFQTYDYNIVKNKTMQVPNPKSARRLVFNRLKVFVRTMLAKMSADTPHMGVMPKTGENEDVKAAKLGENVSVALFEKLKFRQVKQNLNAWLVILNRAYLRVFWNEDDHGVVGYENKELLDEESGEVVLDQETGEPILTEEIEEIEDDGDVGAEAVNPFMCRHDPISVNRKKWKWFLFGEVACADALEEQYNLKEGSLIDKGEGKVDTSYELEMGWAGDVAVSHPDKKEEITGRTVLRKELWTPNIYVFMAGDQVLKCGINKYKEIRFYRFEDRIIPIDSGEKGIHYNDSLVKQAIPIQREFNRQKSIVSTALERASKMKIMLPLNSILSRKSMTNEFGTFVDVNTQLGKPEQLRMDPLPSFIQVYINDLEREFETAFSTHEASFGRLPERASHASGALVQILLEQDDAVLNPMLQMMNDILSEAWSAILQMVQDNYSPARLLKYAATDGQQAVESFRGADLKGNTDVKITTQSGLPRGRIARTEYIMKLKEAEILRDPRQILEMLDIGSVERVFDRELGHIRRAERENMLIEKNPNITPEDVKGWAYKLEDHLSHLPIHVGDRIGIKYEDYTDGQKQTLDAHIVETYSVFIELQREQAEVAQEVTPEEKSTGAPVRG